MTIRLGILAPHVIQYHAPLYRELARRDDVQLCVYYCSRRGLDEYPDHDFRHRVQWDIPLLDGYRSEFLADMAPGHRSGFLGHVNPGIALPLVAKRVDVLCVQGWSRSTEWLAFLTALVRRVPVVLRAEARGVAVSGSRSARVRGAILSRLFRTISTFAAIGTEAASFYRALGVAGDRIHLSPYAVDNAFFSRHAVQLAADRARRKADLGIPDVPVALFSGKLIERKRPEDLLEAHRRLPDPRAAAVVIVGDGPLMDPLRQFAAKHRLPNVFFAGFQNQSQLPNWYSIADFLVLPSRYETWGLVVNEAMCFGLPVISTDGVGACADLVSEGVSGFVIPVGNVDALTARMAELIRDRALRDRMSRASREVIGRWGLPEAASGIAESAAAAVAS